MGKVEIAHEQYLLFPQCFQKACFPGASKGVIVWNGLNYCGCLVARHFIYSIDSFPKYKTEDQPKLLLELFQSLQIPPASAWSIK